GQRTAEAPAVFLFIVALRYLFPGPAMRRAIPAFDWIPRFRLTRERIKHARVNGHPLPVGAAGFGLGQYNLIHDGARDRVDPLAGRIIAYVEQFRRCNEDVAVDGVAFRERASPEDSA